MKVVICKAPKKIIIEEIEVPKIKNDEVLVKIKYCGICSYDLKRYLGLKKTNYPIILGHEPSGEVEKVGSFVKNFEPGDKVLIDVKILCGECINCQRGLNSRCENTEASNGFSQYIVVPKNNLFKISPGVELVTGILAEPLACIIHGFNKIKLKEKSDVLVIGDGIMGMIAAFIAKIIKKHIVTLAGHNNNRLQIATKVGIDFIINIKYNYSKLNKFDAIFLTVEEKKIINDITKYLYQGGDLVFIGELRKGIYNLNLNQIYSNEYKFIGSKGYNKKDFIIAVKIIEKFSKILRVLISKFYNLNELDIGFKDLKERKILKGVLCLND
ncbi:MAG: zinc-dependent alcohol dehydrogenase [Candidatus Helarchaeota archaeon]